MTTFSRSLRGVSVVTAAAMALTLAAPIGAQAAPRGKSEVSVEQPMEMSSQRRRIHRRGGGGNAAAAALMLGVVGAIAGVAIASQNRRQRYYYDEQAYEPAYSYGYAEPEVYYAPAPAYGYRHSRHYPAGGYNGTGLSIQQYYGN